MTGKLRIYRKILYTYINYGGLLMMRRVLLISILVVIIFIVCFVFIVNRTNKLNLSQLNGDLLIEDIIDGKNYTFGAFSYKTSSGDIRLIFNEDYFTPYCFNQDKSKILLVKYIENPSFNDFVIYEYNIQTKRLSGIVKYKESKQNESSTVHFSNVKYIPEHHKISYIRFGQLYVHDIDTESDTLITEIDDCSNYSWSNDGNELIFSNNNEIQVLDISSANKLSATDFQGESPIYSKDEKYIAYLDGDNLKHCLKVRDTVTGEEWSYTTKDIIVNYVFSPDNKYLAIVEKNTGLINFGAHVSGHIKVWDFKNSAFGTLIKHYESNTIDWK